MMLTAYVNLEKIIDSVHPEALWNLLDLHGIPAGIHNLLTGMYSENGGMGGISNFFLVNTG